MKTTNKQKAEIKIWILIHLECKVIIEKQYNQLYLIGFGGMEGMGGMPGMGGMGG